MSAERGSPPSTPAEEEDRATCQLTFTTMEGEIREHDRLDELEDAVVDFLPKASNLDTFGCEIDFVHPHTKALLEDPIWETLQSNTHFNLVVRTAIVVLEHKQQLQSNSCVNYPKAIRVPTNFANTIPDSAFASIPRIRLSFVGHPKCHLGDRCHLHRA